MTSEKKTSKDREEIGHLEEILQQDPASPKFFRLADAYTREGRFLDAIRLSKQGLKHHPEHAKGYVALGRALFGSGNLPKAVKVLWKSLDLQVTESEPFRLLGEILLWQTAPTEAVTVLERALALGYDEPSIQNVLQRAMDAVEREKTGIIEHLQQKKRGIGNVAVAGTIGTTSHGIHGPLTAEVTRRVAFPQEPEGSVTPTIVQGGVSELEDQSAPEVDQEGADGAGAGAGWNTIDSEWSRQLDVQDLPSFPDIDSDVNAGQRGGHHDSMPLAPLMDPLEEGIPPVPLDAIDTGETLLPPEPGAGSGSFPPGEDEAQTSVDQRSPSESARTTVTPFIPPERGAGPEGDDQAQARGEQDQARAVSPGPAHADTVPAMAAVGPEIADTVPAMAAVEPGSADTVPAMAAVEPGSADTVPAMDAVDSQNVDIQHMPAGTPGPEDEPAAGTYEGPGTGRPQGQDDASDDSPWAAQPDPSPEAMTLIKEPAAHGEDSRASGGDVRGERGRRRCAHGDRAAAGPGACRFLQPG